MFTLLLSTTARRSTSWLSTTLHHVCTKLADAKSTRLSNQAHTGQAYPHASREDDDLGHVLGVDALLAPEGPRHPHWHHSAQAQLLNHTLQRGQSTCRRGHPAERYAVVGAPGLPCSACTSADRSALTPAVTDPMPRHVTGWGASSM